MKTYYTDTRALHYNQTWQEFSEKTQQVVLALIESDILRTARERGQPLRILDVGCGTGLLLANIARQLPEADLYGIDASQAMLKQAAHLLGDSSQVYLSQASLPENAKARLPFPTAFFDIITCTNTLHYAINPQLVLQEMSRLVVPSGSLVVEDYVLRSSPFPWQAFEWAIKLYDPQHIRLYSLPMVQELGQRLGFKVLDTRTFQIDLFCQGWALLFTKSDAL